MFIRTKTIKQNKYAYLVENTWNHGQSKQTVAKYLGRIIDEGTTNPATTTHTATTETRITLPEAVNELLTKHLKEKGFTKDTTKNTLAKGTLTIDLDNGTVTSNNKPITIKLNEGHVCNHTLKEAKKTPTSAHELATNLTNSGISITPETFLTLAQTILPKQKKEEREKETTKEFYW